MKPKGYISATTLLLSLSIPATAHACSTKIDEGHSIDGGGMLFTRPKLNKNLGCGEYEFAGLNSHHNSSFIDRWKFTVSEDSSASIGVFDIEQDFNSTSSRLQTAGFLNEGTLHRTENSFEHFDAEKLFDTQRLIFRLYDDSGDLLAEGRENETLSGLSLEAGQWYTLKVSGRVAGLFGSAYRGSLDTCVTAVPLGDTAPLLGSALALLALRGRRRASRTA